MRPPRARPEPRSIRGGLAPLPSRFRFTLKRLMIAVALVALAIVAEPWLFDLAVSEVCEGPDRSYLRNEAVEVWAFLNGAILVPVYLFWRAASKGYADLSEPR